MSRAIPLALLLGAAIVGCGKQGGDAPQPGTGNGKQGRSDSVSFITKHARIEFSFPAGWYVNPENNPYDLQCVSPLQEMYTGVFVYKKEDLAIDSTPIDIFWEQVKDLKSKRRNFEELEPVQKQEYDDKTVTSITYVGDQDSSRHCYSFSLIEFGADTSTFAVAIQTAIPEDWKNSKPVLEKIIRSAKPLFAVAPGPNPQGSPQESAQSAEPWASKPPREWPQLVLTNHAEFNGHTGLRGASAFLVKTQDGRTLAASARHLLGENGGVQPEISIAALNEAIKSWRMYPRTLPESFVMAEKVGCSGLDDENLDWLLLTIKNTDKPLPATPLALRSEPAQIGEKVYLVGCPYAERACKQNVYAGKVTARAGDRFRYDIDPPVDIRGFSGAPIIDRNGHVVGVMTVWFKPKMQQEKFLEAGGEDAATVYSLVQRQR